MEPFGIVSTGQSIPAPGDYDGSGLTGLGVYLPALSNFAYQPGGGGPDVVQQFGIVGVGQTLPTSLVLFAGPAPLAGDTTVVAADISLVATELVVSTTVGRANLNHKRAGHAV